MLLDRFLEHLTYEKRYSPHTVQAYRRDLEQYARYLSGELRLDGPENADHRAVRGWMMHLMGAGDQPRTVNRKLSALRAFYRFARTTGSVPTDPTALIDPPRTRGRLPEFITEPRVSELFASLESPRDERAVRDRLIMELFYGTGMRLAELIGLTLGAIDPARATVRVLGKRSKERIIPVGPAILDALEAYLKVRPACPGDPGAPQPLLLGPSGKPLSRRSVQRLVDHYLRGVTTQGKKSPHVLRHTFATHMLEHGADLNAVKELLGHAGLAATQVYTHNTVEKLRSVHAQAHPRGGARGSGTNPKEH
ncbi:MAG: tyrosine-type recombinase/integrase [Flavobacteriales bacterium]|nr:tyrosine-type recombinase/integrase [Flavobacteriales bacterium]MCB9194410.1 tyrosine-type recombinase/integrase [Flavobacteriales bacterium]